MRNLIVLLIAATISLTSGSIQTIAATTTNTAITAKANTTNVDTNHKLNNNNVNSISNNLFHINNNNTKVISSAKIQPTVFKAPVSSNVLIPKLEPNEFILPSKTIDSRRKDFGQIRIYQPIQPFPSIFLPRSSYEDLSPINNGFNSQTATGFDVTELSKAFEKRLKNIRNLELGVSVVQVSRTIYLINE